MAVIILSEMHIMRLGARALHKLDNYTVRVFFLDYEYAQCVFVGLYYSNISLI